MKTFIITLLTAVIAVLIGAFFTPDIVEWKEGNLHIKVEKSKLMKIPDSELYRTKFVLINSTKKRIFKKDFKQKACIKFLHQNVSLLDLNVIEKDDNHLSIVPMNNLFCFNELDLNINARIVFYIYSTNKIEISNIYFDAICKNDKFSLLEEINELDSFDYKNIAIPILVIIIFILAYMIVLQYRRIRLKDNQLNSSLSVINKKDADYKYLENGFNEIKEKLNVEKSMNKIKIDEMDSELSIFREILKDNVSVKQAYEEYKKKVEEFKKMMKKI